MTIFKLSIAACAALVVGAWAEGAKASNTAYHATSMSLLATSR